MVWPFWSATCHAMFINLCARLVGLSLESLTQFQRPCTTDSTGRSVPLVSPPTLRQWRSISGWHRGWSAQAAGEPWITEHEITMKASQLTGITLSIILIILSFGILFYASDTAPRNIAFFSVGVPTILSMPTYFTFLRIQRQRHHQLLWAAYLSVDRCPSCGSSLQDLQEDDEGFVACAKCSAQWKYFHT